MSVSSWSFGWDLKRKTLIMAVILSMCLILANTPTASATSEESSDPLAEIKVTIEDAYYTDLDGDSIENDVYVLVRFDLAGSPYPYYEFIYIITLRLPSGLEYSYLVYVLAWIDVVYLNNLFFDYATESGDYTVCVEALLLIPDIAYDAGEYVFDPPGGSEGGKPTFGVY